jgi:hypothetical protein
MKFIGIDLISGEILQVINSSFAPTDTGSIRFVEAPESVFEDVLSYDYKDKEFVRVPEDKRLERKESRSSVVTSKIDKGKLTN